MDDFCALDGAFRQPELLLSLADGARELFALFVQLRRRFANFLFALRHVHVLRSLHTSALDLHRFLPRD